MLWKVLKVLDVDFVKFSVNQMNNERRMNDWPYRQPISKNTIKATQKEMASE